MIHYLKHLRSYRGNIIKFKKNFPHLTLPNNPWQYFSVWHKSLDVGRGPIVDRKPWITIPAVNWLENNIHQGWKVFEYGMGGSTLFFSDNGCSIVSVEHHKNWFEDVKTLLQGNESVVTHLEEPKAYGGNEAFVSEFAEWQGMSFESYVRIAETIADQSLDLALVDGRARVQCVQAIKQKIKSGGYILFDNAERPRYQEGIEILQKEGWRVIHFAGPGYYEQGWFWCTILFQKQ